MPRVIHRSMGHLMKPITMVSTLAYTSRVKNGWVGINVTNGQPEAVMAYPYLAFTYVGRD